MRRIDSLRLLQGLIYNEEAAIQFFGRFRWVKGYCPYCGHDKRYGTRKPGSYRCAKCRSRYSIRVGTIFEGTKLPLRSWLLAIWYLANEPGISSVELAQKLGITQKTAWLILNRLYQASRTRSFKGPLIDDEEFDQEIVNAVADLGRSINLSTGLDHPGDLRRAEIFMGRLIDEKPYVDPAKVRRWAMKHNWDFGSAVQLEDVVIKIKSHRKIRVV